MILNEQLKQNEGYKTAAFEMYVKGKISEKMYREYADLYEKKCVEIRTVIETRKQTMQDVMDRKKPHIEWVEYFEKHKDFKELDRLLLVRTVKRIYIHPNKRIEIEFIHQADYNAAMEYIAYARKMAKAFDAKEAF